VPNFKIAVAQISSEKGNIDKNIQDHVKAIQCAIEHAVSIVVFPELSLTGYEPELAENLALTIDDERLNPIQEIAVNNSIYVVVGAPIKTKDISEIGVIIFSPDGSITSYSKMNLHPGEEKYFKAGKELKTIAVKNQKVAIAICADTNNPMHVKAYAENGASIYAAGVLITEGGYTPDTEKLHSYARQYHMLVTMANHCQPTGGWQPVGKSSAWDENGILAVAGIDSKSLLISEKISNHWRSVIVEI
jgi:predicted amidohydrolase